ncbi:MAG: hypothetical protein AABX11_06630 [Nanoarchaeota archaeon]
MALKEFKEGDILFCTVTNIESTAVLVKIEDFGKGSIVMSEIAAGRIRNLREYVVQNKRIICKVLKVYPDHLELSLRRVTGKEREELIEKDKKEKVLIGLLKGTISNSAEVIKTIKEEHDLGDFFDEIKANPELMDKYLKKADIERFAKLLKEKEETEKTSKGIIIVKTTSSNGLEDIKSLLSEKETKNSEIKYLGSSQFSVETKGKDFKEANISLQGILKALEAKAKSKKMLFQIKP